MEQITLHLPHALGDVVVMSAVVRDIELAYPGRYSIFTTGHFQSLWKNFPNVTPASLPGRGRFIDMSYQHKIDQARAGSKKHFLTSFYEIVEEKLGIKIPMTKASGHLLITPGVTSPVSGKYWVSAPGGKTDLTTKIWLPSRHQKVVDILASKGIRCVQAGGNFAEHVNPILTNVTQALNATRDIEDFFALIAGAEGVICGITSLMHIAAVFDKPCVPADTVISTADGLDLVTNLLDKPFVALHNGQEYQAPHGFWRTGKKPLLLLTFKSGRQLRVTKDHEILTPKGWREARALSVGDSVVLHNHRSFTPTVDIRGADYARGYCLGNFLGDGTIDKNSARMSWFSTNAVAYRRTGLGGAGRLAPCAESYKWGGGFRASPVDAVATVRSGQGLHCWRAKMPYPPDNLRIVVVLGWVGGRILRR